MTARLLGIGTAVPEGFVTQHEAAALAAALLRLDAETARRVSALYRRSGVRERSSVLASRRTAGEPPHIPFFPPATGPDDHGPGTRARLERYAADAPTLAAAACLQALERSEIQGEAISHLVTVSCTGFAAPGMDTTLIEQLRLPRTTQRTHVGFMGCHGAINGLRVAKAFAEADPAATVLVAAVELCTPHFHYTPDAEKMVANALFADGAAAAVVTVRGPETAPRLAACGSRLIPDSRDAMTWTIGDHGFEMTLSPRLPAILEEHLRDWTASWLEACGSGLDAVGSWAVHPGGPRVLATAARCLGLPDAALAVSRGVLADHGNMSSPTVLFILDRLLRANAPRPIAALAFGPGLTAEGALLT